MTGRVATHRAIASALLIAISSYATAGAAGQETEKTAQGRVFADVNRDGKWNPDERGVAGVQVSNGRRIVVTDRQGRYRLPVDDDSIVFVIKPRGYQTRLDGNNLPQFYYIHKPKGSPQLKFPGVEPTGPLPESVDFPLYAKPEPDKFSSILFGDPQPRDQREIDYIAHDVVEDLIGSDAAFGVTLGDILFDDLSLFGSMNRTVGKIGIPWYNVIGNHDINTDAATDAHSDETFERHFGPSYYSYNYGPVHFVVLDDVLWVGTPADKKHYHGGLGPRQLEFLENDLKAVPRERLVVLFMHIPLVNSTPWDQDERKRLYALLKDRPHCMSVSAHAHHHEHILLGKEQGFEGAKKHHHVVNVTVSGAWWQGAPNEYGIPHAMMADGAPNGHSVLHFDGNKYRMAFRAAGRPADFQMHIHAPEELSASRTDIAVYANVFNALPQSRVEMRVGDGPFRPMTFVREPDPVIVRAKQLDDPVKKNFRAMPAPKPSPHLWKAQLPADLPAGTHVITVRGKTHEGKLATDRRIVRVVGK